MAMAGSKIDQRILEIYESNKKALFDNLVKLQKAEDRGDRARTRTYRNNVAAFRHIVKEMQERYGL